MKFNFGENWHNFSKNINDSNLESAKKSLRELSCNVDFKNKKFLDIGCGSGLSTIAASRLGSIITGFDENKIAVQTAKKNCRIFNAKQIRLIQGSILDSKFLLKLGKFDIVYSWGVLHHTGDLKKALNLTSTLVNKNGILIISIYNDQGGTSKRWLKIKRFYNGSNKIIKFILLLVVGFYFELKFFIVRIINLKNPLPFDDWNKKKNERGMSVWYDLIDWVGGYPFEVSKPENFFDFYKKKGFKLINLKTCGGGLGCNEFTFKKIS